MPKQDHARLLLEAEMTQLHSYSVPIGTSANTVYEWWMTDRQKLTSLIHKLATALKGE